MTRTHLKSLLVALSLVALAAAPARSDSLSKIRKSPKKDAAAEKEDVVHARYSTDGDDCDDDGYDDGSGSRMQRLRNRLHRYPSADGSVYVDGPACYPQLNSSLYPCPKANVPVEVRADVHHQPGVLSARDALRPPVPGAALSAVLL